jgi:hypothetical protein
LKEQFVKDLEEHEAIALRLGLEMVDHMAGLVQGDITAVADMWTTEEVKDEDVGLVDYGRDGPIWLD